MKWIPVRRRPFLLSLAVCVCAAGCLETDIPPPGSYSEVMLVTEDGPADPLSSAMESHLGHRIDYFVSEDAQFKVHEVRAADLADVPFKNVVFCGPATATTHVGQRISALLGAQAVERARAGQANIFRKDDLPGPGQTTIIVTGASADDVADLLDVRGAEVREALEASCRERMRRYLLKDRESPVGQQLYAEYGFQIRVPTLYRLLSESLDPPGIELLRDGPTRSLGIFWLDWDAPPTLNDAEALFEIRQEYVRARYDGDTMDSTRVRYVLDRLGEYPAVRMEGYWSNPNALAGGVYNTYFVFAPSERLLWAVDLLVFAPGLPKPPLFRELTALAETFRYN